MGLGLGSIYAGGPPTDYTDPNNWTLVGEWDSRDGTGIDGDLSWLHAWYTFNSGDGMYWSPSGTLLTLCNNSDDIVTTFNCSIPFDPESAFSVAGNDGNVNPGNLKFAFGGTSYLMLRSGDNVDRYPSASPYVVKGQAVSGRHSTISKNDIGYNGASDGFWTHPQSMNYILWHAPEPGSPFHNFLHYITLGSGGNLDLPPAVLQDSENVEAQLNNINAHMTDLSLDELYWYISTGNNGIRRVTLDSPHDISTVNYESVVDVGAQFNSAAGQWDCDSIWINPFDTEFVWIMGDDGSQQIQMAKFATGA